MPMKMQSKSMRVWLALLLAALLCACCVSALADAKTLTVAGDGTGDYATIQGAIDAASSGDTIVIKEGTYDRFYVKPGISNLTIKAAEGAKVVVNVLDGKTGDDAKAIYGGSISGAECGEQCCLIRGTNITLSGLNFKSLGQKKQWYDAAVAVYTGGVVKIENCDFVGTDNIGYGVLRKTALVSLL